MTSLESENAFRENQGIVFPARFALRPWEDRLGAPVESPLVPLIIEWMKETRIACGRFFLLPTENDGLTEKDLQQALDKIEIVSRTAIVRGNEILLPAEHKERYPLRFDLMDHERIRGSLLGGGRALLDGLQPQLHDDAVVPPGAYAIGATRCSMVRYRGVLQSELIKTSSGERTPSLRHGTSRLWDGGKTTGIDRPRHLEVINGDPGASRVLSDYAVGMRVYHSLNGNNGLMHAVMRNSSRKVQHEGLHFDHVLCEEGMIGQLRDILTSLPARGLNGTFLGVHGVLDVAAERHLVQQDQACVAALYRYLRREDTRETELTDLSGMFEHMGDPRQRICFLTDTAPSCDVLRQMMEHGVRTIVTSNISRNGEKIYISNQLLEGYSQLAEEGLDFYLMMPHSVRKLWKKLFVDIRSLEKVRQADLRICVYCASAANAELLLERGGYVDFLRMLKKDYPNAAIVTGASRNGAMYYANSMARTEGITTIGIANHIQGQETTEVDLDAAMFFDRDGFSARQALMARIGTCPFIGPGAQGSEFEGALERCHAKIGNSNLAPIIYIDPIGLGENGKHMWQPVMELERQFAAVHRLDEDTELQLTRSPYVGHMTHAVDSYAAAYESVLRPFLEDPQDHWDQWGVPTPIVFNAMQRASRDHAYTGLPIPLHLLPVMERLDIS